MSLTLYSDYVIQNLQLKYGLERKQAQACWNINVPKGNNEITIGQVRVRSKSIGNKVFITVIYKGRRYTFQRGDTRKNSAK